MSIVQDIASLARVAHVVRLLLLLLLLASESSLVAALKRVQSVPNGQLTDCNAGTQTQCIYFEPLYTFQSLSLAPASLPPNQPRVEAWHEGRFNATCNEERGFCQFSVPHGVKITFSLRCVQPQPQHELGRVFGLLGNTSDLRADSWGRFVVRGDRTKARWGDKELISGSKPLPTYSKRQSQQLTIYCN